MPEPVAADSIEIRIVPIGRGPRRVLMRIAAAIVLVASAVLQSATLIPTSRIQVVRRGTGEVLAQDAPDPEIRIVLLDRMRSALHSMPEAAFIERWCDPSTWTALARE